MLQAEKSRRKIPHPRSEGVCRIAGNPKLRVQAKPPEEDTGKEKPKQNPTRFKPKVMVWTHPFFYCISITTATEPVA